MLNCRPNYRNRSTTEWDREKTKKDRIVIGEAPPSRAGLVERNSESILQSLSLSLWSLVFRDRKCFLSNFGRLTCIKDNNKRRRDIIDNVQILIVYPSNLYKIKIISKHDIYEILTFPWFSMTIVYHVHRSGLQDLGVVSRVEWEIRMLKIPRSIPFFFFRNFFKVTLLINTLQTKYIFIH